jgi:hypothetical protein
VSRRDAYLLSVIGVLAVLGGFFFLVLGPKRSDLSKLDKQVASSQAELQTAKQEAGQFKQARDEFQGNYTTVARLGKAVPADPDTPSLIVQLERAANDAHVNFRKLTLESGSGNEAAASPAPAPAPTTASPSGTTGATGASGAAPTGTSGASGAAGSTGAPAAANAIATPSMPLGVDVGPAGLSISRFSLEFQGSFFHMADFIHNIRSLVQRRNKQLLVSGRLVTVDGISLNEGDSGFPQVKAAIAATAYLVPPSQGLFAGATTQGPGGATGTTPAPPTGVSAPPVAVVTP